MRQDYEQLPRFALLLENSLEARDFTTPGHLAKQVKNSCGQAAEPLMRGIYCQPWCRTQESFDSLTVIHVANNNTLVVFQITMTSTHEAKAGGVSEILEALPKTMKQVFIIFVVLEDWVDTYLFPQRAH